MIGLKLPLSKAQQMNIYNPRSPFGAVIWRWELSPIVSPISQEAGHCDILGYWLGLELYTASVSLSGLLLDKAGN